MSENKGILDHFRKRELHESHECKDMKYPIQYDLTRLRTSGENGLLSVTGQKWGWLAFKGLCAFF